MSRTQKILITLFPKSWVQSMEKESREWMMRCENCQFEKSVWDLGGIRWKASGNPRRKLMCQNCKYNSWHSTYKRTEE